MRSWPSRVAAAAGVLSYKTLTGLFAVCRIPHCEQTGKPWEVQRTTGLPWHVESLAAMFAGGYGQDSAPEHGPVNAPLLRRVGFRRDSQFLEFGGRLGFDRLPLAFVQRIEQRLQPFPLGEFFGFPAFVLGTGIRVGYGPLLLFRFLRGFRARSALEFSISEVE